MVFLTRRKDEMTEHTAIQAKNLRKKLQKREQRIIERLKGTQKAQTRALERYHRAEEYLQKSIARVQLIEGRLILVRQQIDDLHANPEIPSVEIEIPAWAQYIPPSSYREDTSRNTIESTDFASEARAAAKAAEENTRIAAARAAEINETTNVNLETAEVAEIEAEEEFVEAITAVTIAEITAERAAAAEALAEASSARTREARRQAKLAEEALGEIRVAIRNDLLKGDEAKHALQEAEREVTKAQASLADAEVAEEQALAAAMNAEAEAEVAEGMAYAAVDRSDTLLEEAQNALDNEPDIMRKIPNSQAQEME
jgi:hypothetical protein